MAEKNLSSKFKIIYLLIILPILFFIDQFSKQLATEHLAGKESIDLLGSYFQLIYAQNTGAFLGIGAQLPCEVRIVVFVLIVAVGLVGMLWYLIRKEKSQLNLLAYSFILAGGLGNLFDRMINPNGYVVDFLFIQIYGPLRTGVFNLADVEIVIGVLLMIYKEYIYDRGFKAVR